MGKRVVVDPITRLEGHLAIDVELDDNNVVTKAKSKGMLFRGIELLLKDRNPLDAQRITQRICGVCPTAHCTASTLNLDSAFVVKGTKDTLAGAIPDNGRIIRNLILGSNYIQSHILHFYHLAALDYVDVTDVLQYTGKDPNLNQVKSFLGYALTDGKLDTTKVANLAPFWPRYGGLSKEVYKLPKEANIEATKHYVEALNMRRFAQEMLAVWGGHMPHNKGIVPGGATENVSVDKIADTLWKLNKLQKFINDVYIPDVLAVAGVYSEYFGIGAGYGNFLAYGAFELDTEADLTKRKRFLPQGIAEGLELGKLDPKKITESVKNSKFDGKTLHPEEGVTKPNHHKEGAYSWVKSPRYDGKVFEVGPLANQLVAYLSGVEQTKGLVDYALKALGNAPVTALNSVLGRHAARAIECKVVADQMANWLVELTKDPAGATHTPFDIPNESQGMGITSAPRGSLGHWITIKNHKIANYQAVVPTTWNAGPMDEKGQVGPFEKSLIGTKVANDKEPIELTRIIRSFDPCLACAIHVVTPKSSEKKKFIV